MKFRPLNIILILIASSLLISACGADTSFLLVNNGSTAEICEINITADSSNGWGQDWLNGDSIPAGGEYEFADIEVGSYDLRFVPCDLSSFTVTEDQDIDLTDNIEYTLFDI